MSTLTHEQFLKRLAGLKLLSLDTDGVLTDGGLYYTDDGEELRKFNVKDGMGMKRAQAAGVKIAIITASSTPSIAHRGNRLGVDYVFLDCEDKLQTLVRICDEMGIDLDQVGHVGDDLNDLPVLGVDRRFSSLVHFLRDVKGLTSKFFLYRSINQMWSLIEKNTISSLFIRLSNQGQES